LFINKTIETGNELYVKGVTSSVVSLQSLIEDTNMQLKSDADLDKIEEIKALEVKIDSLKRQLDLS